MKVTLPSGKSISGIPEGTSPDEIKRAAIAGGLATEQDFSYNEPAPVLAPPANQLQEQVSVSPPETATSPGFNMTGSEEVAPLPQNQRLPGENETIVEKVRSRIERITPVDSFTDYYGQAFEGFSPSRLYEGAASSFKEVAMDFDNQLRGASQKIATEELNRRLNLGQITPEQWEEEQYRRQSRAGDQEAALTTQQNVGEALRKAEADATPEDLDYIQRAIRSGTSSLAMNAPATAMSIMQKNPLAMAYYGGNSFNDAYSEARREGFDTETAALRGLGHGTLEVVTELIPGKFLGDLGKGLGKDMGKTIVKEMTAEQIGEAANFTAQTKLDIELGTGVGAVWDEMSDEQKANYMKKNLQDIAGATLFASGVQTGMAAGVGTGLRKLEERATEREIEQALEAPEQGITEEVVASLSPEQAQVTAEQQQIEAVPTELRETEIETPTDVRYKLEEREGITDEQRTESTEPMLGRAIGRGGEPGIDTGPAETSEVVTEDSYGGIPVSSIPEVEQLTLDENTFNSLFGAGIQQEVDLKDAATQWKEKGTDSPYFKNWFQDSKLRNKQGKPIKVYHGTKGDFEAFDPNFAGKRPDGQESFAASGLGVFLTSDKGLSEAHGDKVLEGYARMENPYVMSVEESASFESVEQAKQRAEELKREGHDGVLIRESKTAIVFEPQQFKHVGNRGTFEERPEFRKSVKKRTDVPRETKGPSHRQIVKAIEKSPELAKNIRIVRKMSALPRSLQREVRKEMDAGKRVPGVFHKGKAYVIAENVKDIDEAVKTAIHEVVGHKGLRGALGKEIGPILDSVYKSKDKTLAKLREDIEQRYPDADKFEVAEEMIAHYAEKAKKPTAIEWAIARIKEIMRQVFDVNMSTKDVKILLERSRDYIKEQRPADIQTATKDVRYAKKLDMSKKARMQRAKDMGFDTDTVYYHGSGSLESLSSDGFRSDLTGKGNDQYGSGFYFTTFPSTASGYSTDRISSDTEKLGGEDSPGVVKAFLAVENPVDATGKRNINDGVFDLTSDQVRAMLDYSSALKRSGDDENMNPAGDHFDSFWGGGVESWMLDELSETYAGEQIEAIEVELFDENSGEFRKALSEVTGHDGVIVEFDETGEKHVVAWFPDQVRSTFAAFDPSKAESSDLRFSKKPQLSMDKKGPDTFSLRDETNMDAFIRQFQDKLKRLKTVQEEITKTGRTIEEDANPYRAEELFHGKVEEDLRKLDMNYVEPLVEKMAESGVTQDELDMYLWAKHAPERNKYIASINNEMPDGGSGMPTEKANRVVKTMESSDKGEALKDISKDIYSMSKLRLKILEKYGLEDKDVIAEYKDQYKNYVPLKGFAYDENQESMPKIGQGFNIKGNETMKALGRKSMPDSPMSYVIRDVTETIIRNRKNEVGNQFLKLVQDNPAPNLWEVFTKEKPDSSRKIDKRKKVTKYIENEKTGKKEPVVMDNPNYNKVIAKPMSPAEMKGEDYFVTKKDGKEYYVKIKDKRLMEAMKNLGVDSQGRLVQALGRITRFLSTLSTSLNPEFVVSNFARDIQTALFNVAGEQTMEGGKLKDKKLTKQIVRDVPKSIRAVYRGERDKDMTNEFQKYYKEFREAGAKTGFFDSKDIEQIKKDLTKLSNRSKQGASAWTKKQWFDGLKFVEAVNTSIENGVRLSTYVNARKSGLSKDQAASVAKNLTVNFNRKGELGSVMNAVYMFFNAAVQGTAQFARALGIESKSGKLKDVRIRRNKAQDMAAAIAVAAWLLGEVNRQMSDEDDDGDKYYDKIPDYIKERNMILMKGDGKGGYWKFPLPYGYNIFHVSGTTMNDMMRGTKTPAEAATMLLGTTVGSFAPIGVSQSESNLNAAIKTASPTVIKPFVELGFNENFFGTPIYKESLPFGVQSPESSQAMRSTGEVWKQTAQWLNSVTGGNLHVSGGLDVSPDALEHIFEFSTGGLGRFADRVYTVTEKGLKGEEIETRTVPFLRTVAGEPSPWEDYGKYYQRRTGPLQHLEAFENLPSAERKQYKENYGEYLRIGKLSKAIDKRLRKLRKLKKQAEARDAKMRVKEIDARIDAEIDRFNKAYNEEIRDK